MRAKRLKKLLIRRLGYRVVRQAGSHCTMEADGRPTLTFALHDGDTAGPVLVRKILMSAGLSHDEAKEVYRNG